jgi:hypothetical protein
MRPTRRNFLELLTTTVAASVTLGSAMQKTRDWRPLFDGRTTAGWRGYRQKTLPAGWQVVGGALTRVGDSTLPRQSASSSTRATAGDIVTIDQFADFELVLEWKIAPGGNSGIFYRVTEDDEVIWHTAPEVQVIDDAGYKEPLKPEQKSGANYDLHAPVQAVAKPAGSWNDTRILVNGNYVEHWLNGVRVVEYELGSRDWDQRVKASKFKDYQAYGRARRGHIGLQDHGDVVAYRNIRVRELT